MPLDHLGDAVHHVAEAEVLRPLGVLHPGESLDRLALSAGLVDLVYVVRRRPMLWRISEYVENRLGRQLCLLKCRNRLTQVVGSPIGEEHDWRQGRRTARKTAILHGSRHTAFRQ